MRMISMKWIAIYSLLALMLALLPWSSGEKAHAAAPAALPHSAEGHDAPAMEPDYRIELSGYFDEDLTSYDESVKRHSALLFQRDDEPGADGLAGPDTWLLLHEASISRDELDLLARIIYAESRGEPYVGQVAVGAVVLNRLDASSFPNTVEGVIEQSGAFTAVDDGQYRLEPDRTAYKAALDAVRGIDPTDGALYYFNPDTATSSWIWTREQTGKIGRHLFAV